MEKASGSSCDLSSHHFECVACSDNSVFCVSVEKQCFRLVEDPRGMYIFKSISSLDRLKIKSVACGADFVLCLTVTGQIYSQGIGSRGQLGLEDLDDRDEFTFIEALAPVTITRISAGKWHAACVTGNKPLITSLLLDTGDLYTWGWNDCGQLGLPSIKLRKSDPLYKNKDLSECDSVVCCPRLVDLPQDACVVEVSHRSMSCKAWLLHVDKMTIYIYISIYMYICIYIFSDCDALANFFC
ncbi:RCC1 domain-containing protein 1 [Fasciolopsis buskii]|uniref:RCC1 domain-containing protein 1 n=1 Tax=Fasciolopsis buskii TaxID=27845 RepID=A0A8E0VGL3_9TREM|nr:RCC1 domain-containing protein 1 [Fasciolopsis buski]